MNTNIITKFSFNNQYIFKELSLLDRKRLEQVMHKRKYLKNQAIYTQGSVPNGIFFVNEGKLKKFKVDNEGREQIIYIYNQEEFFGYSAILSEETYSASTSAIENSVISFIYKEDFLSILDCSPDFSRLLLKSLSHEFRVMINLIAVLSQRTVRERVALSLLVLQDKYKGNKGGNISISRHDLASMAGTVIETLARILHDFKHENLILLNGRNIKVMEYSKLMDIANFY